MYLLEFCTEFSQHAKTLSDERLKKLKLALDTIFKDKSYFFLKDDLKDKFSKDEIEVFSITATMVKDEIYRREMFEGLNKSVVETTSIIQELHKEMKTNKNQ